MGATSQVEGNMGLLLLLNSRQEAEYQTGMQAVLPALDHFGMPYRILDLANMAVDEQVLNDSAVVVVAQKGLGNVLERQALDAIIKYVLEGGGLVSFDSGIHACSRDYQSLFSLTVEKRDRPLTAAVAVSCNNDHYITGTRTLGERLEFRQELELSAKISAGKGVLLESEARNPLVVAGGCGRGKTVQFLLPPEIWLNSHLGHAFGLDDVFWKSIVWAARKPFAMLAMPPFVTAVFDDCSGSYDRFGWIDVFNKFGYIPQAALFPDEVDDESSKALRRFQEKGLAEFPAHGVGFNEQLFMAHDRDKPIYPSEEWLKNKFGHIDRLYEKWGIKWPKVVNPHFAEIGRSSIPFIKERGGRYLLNFFGSFDEAYYGLHKKITPGPYGHPQAQLDYDEDDRDFFRVRPPYESWRGQEWVDDDHFRLISANRHTTADFLYTAIGFANSQGNKQTPKGSLPPEKMEEAVNAAVHQMRCGLDNLFFGMIHSHEQPLSELSHDDLEKMLAMIEARTGGYDKIFKSFDYIAEYAENRHRSQVASCRYFPENNRIECEIRGKSEMDLQLYVFEDVGTDIRQRFETIPAYDRIVKVGFECAPPTKTGKN